MRLDYDIYPGYTAVRGSALTYTHVFVGINRYRDNLARRNGFTPRTETDAELDHLVAHLPLREVAQGL